MGKSVHTSKLRIYQKERPSRRACMEGFDELYYSLRGGTKEFYGIDPEVEYPATLGNLVAPAGG